MSKYGSMRRPASKISTKKQVASLQRSVIRGVLILFLATLMIVFIFGDHGLLQLYKLKRERSKIQNHISELRKDREGLIKEKARLENDLKYIEKLAREKYRMAKPVRSASSQKAKRYAIKKPGKFKPKYKKAPVSRIKSGGPTLKKASKAYKAFSYSVG